MSDKYNDIALMIAFTLTFVIGFSLGGVVMTIVEPIETKEPTELQQKYEEYVKENEWKNEYIEWLQDQLYKKYEGVE